MHSHLNSFAEVRVWVIGGIQLYLSCVVDCMFFKSSDWPLLILLSFLHLCEYFKNFVFHSSMEEFYFGRTLSVCERAPPVSVPHSPPAEAGTCVLGLKPASAYLMGAHCKSRRVLRRNQWPYVRLSFKPSACKWQQAPPGTKEGRN